MLPEKEKDLWRRRIADSEHPRELAIDLMFALQARGGFLSDAALEEGATLLGLSPLALEELATFYPFLYRQPVGRYVIHVCDSLICFMEGSDSLLDCLCRSLGIPLGGTTEDGLFTLLPVCCIGYCDRSPAMMINQRVYGRLTPEKIDRIIASIRSGSEVLP